MGVCIFSEKFPVTIAPLRLVGSSIQSRGATGLEWGSQYLLLPNLYIVDSTDILLEPDWVKPKYIGPESKELRWLTGWVYFDVLAEKYSQDPLIQQCIDPKLQREQLGTYEFKADGITKWKPPISIVERTMVNKRSAVHVRILTPIVVKYRRKGWHFEPYVALL